jgi:pimeloyl-ACP methyl ester carboxylesterase
MNTSFATSTDGTRIAYDVTGTGPAVMLLHGGDRTRRNWHEAGYVERLMDEFTVITVDIRGHGESDMPIDPIEYTTDKLNQDLLAVADACGVERFTIWGFSYGGNVGRYLATQSDRVAKMIIVGIPFGLGASGAVRRWIEDFLAHWTPIVQAQRAGTLDLNTLSQDDRGSIQHGNIPVTLAWLTAMLDWTAIEPADLPCPTLWLVGSEDKNAMSSTKHYEAVLTGSNVQVCIIDGLNHFQEFTSIDRVLPVMLSFIQS